MTDFTRVKGFFIRHRGKIAGVLSFILGVIGTATLLAVRDSMEDETDDDDELTFDVESGYLNFLEVGESNEDSSEKEDE